MFADGVVLVFADGVVLVFADGFVLVFAEALCWCLQTALCWCFSIFFEPAEFYCRPGELAARQNGGVAVLAGRRVVRLDVTRRRAYLDCGAEISYDKCLLATGTRGAGSRHWGFMYGGM